MKNKHISVSFRFVVKFKNFDYSRKPLNKGFVEPLVRNAIFGVFKLIELLDKQRNHMVNDKLDDLKWHFVVFTLNPFF
jgi:hypothetical protein